MRRDEGEDGSKAVKRKTVTLNKRTDTVVVENVDVDSKRGYRGVAREAKRAVWERKHRHA